MQPSSSPKETLHLFKCMTSNMYYSDPKLSHIQMRNNYISISKTVSSYFYVQMSLVNPCLPGMYTLSDVCVPRLCRGTWSSGTVNLKSTWEVSVAWLLLFRDDMGLRKMEFLSLNLFNALKICLSGLSGIWQELWLSIASSLQREDAAPSRHSEMSQEEILRQQGYIKSCGTRRHRGLWFSLSRNADL